MTVLCLTWESPYLRKTVFILRWGLGFKQWLVWHIIGTKHCKACIHTSRNWVIIVWDYAMSPSSRPSHLLKQCRPRSPFTTIPDSKVYGANMGSIWGRQDPGGPHVSPMNQSTGHRRFPRANRQYCGKSFHLITSSSYSALQVNCLTEVWHRPVLRITMTSWWARWCLKSPAFRLFTQPFIQEQIEEKHQSPALLPLCGEFNGDRWIPRTNGQ